VFLSLYLRIGVFIYSAPQLQECLKNLLTYLLTYLQSYKTLVEFNEII